MNAWSAAVAPRHGGGWREECLSVYLVRNAHQAGLLRGGARAAQRMSRSSVPPDLVPGRRIASGKYELLRKIGVGAMGEVWTAKHLSLDEEVAIKPSSAASTMTTAPRRTAASSWRPASRACCRARRGTSSRSPITAATATWRTSSWSS